MVSFDDLIPQQGGSAGGLFDDLVPGGGQPAPAKAPVARAMPADATGLPQSWSVDIGGKKLQSRLTSLPDGRTVYALPLKDGRTGIVQRRKDNGELILKPYEAPEGSRGFVRDLGDAALGLAQGAADVVVNAPARLVDIAVNAPARAIDKAFGLEGPSLDQLASDAIGTAPSLDQALANQNEGFARATGDSQAGRIGRVTGNIAATVPLAAGRVVEGTGGVANLINGAAQGGAGAGLVATGRGSDDVVQEAVAGTVAGGAMGVLLPPAVKAIGAGIGRTREAASPSVAAEVGDDLVQQAKQAVSRAQLSWDELDDPLRSRILRELQQAKSISDSIPEDAIVRKAVYEAQGLKPTRAMVTRDWTDAWREQNLMTEPEGDALRNIYVRNNATIRQALDDLAPRGVVPQEAPTFGSALRGSLSGAERQAAGEVKKAYDAAAAAEGDLPFDTQPLVNYMQDNLSMLNATNSGKPVIAYMEKMGIISPKNMQPIVGENGLPGLGFKAQPITMKEAVGLRSVVNRAWSSAQKSGDDVAAAQLNEMRQMLNTAEFQAGGDLYKAARVARQAKGNAFENNPLIDKLLSRQKGYNADLIEDSQVFDRAIAKSSPEQFKATWLRIDEPTRKQTQAQMADFIKGQVFSNQGRNEAGDVVASAAKLDKVLRDIGPQKLRLVFGEQRAKDMQMLAKSLGEISNPPKGTVPQGSAPKLGFLSRALLGTLNLGGNATGSALLAGGAESIRRGGQALANREAAANALDIYGPYKREVLQQMGSRAGLFAAPPAGVGAPLLLDSRVSKRPK